MDASEVCAFWFDTITPAQQFAKDAALDAHIADRFTEAHRAATAGELACWRDSHEGRLAEIIILDQFSRNLFREQAGAFSFDGMALALAQEAVAAGTDRQLAPRQRHFLYMPYMHSESRLIHTVAVRLYSQPGLEQALKHELAHKAIIDQFGRYPHRNEALGRRSSAKEIAFLRTAGSSF